MTDKLFANPDIAFIVVATVITIAILFLRLVFKKCVLLWKSTLISYISFVILLLTRVVYEHYQIGIIAFLNKMLFETFSMILLIPSWLVYCLVPRGIKSCPSNFDVFAWHTIGFFYMIVIWGIMKIIKMSKAPKAAEKKQDNIAEKQTPTETEI